MRKLHGPISDRLRKLFGPNDPAWTPARPAQPKRAKKLPKGVAGQQVGGKPGRKKGK